MLDLTERSGCLSPAVGGAQGPREAMCPAVPNYPLSYITAALITVICVVLTCNVAALKDASVGSVVALVLLLVALLVPTVIIWRQPQSNARLNFKVSTAPSILVPAPPWTPSGSGHCRVCQGSLPGSHQERPGS